MSAQKYTPANLFKKLGKASRRRTADVAHPEHISSLAGATDNANPGASIANFQESGISSRCPNLLPVGKVSQHSLPVRVLPWL